MEEEGLEARGPAPTPTPNPNPNPKPYLEARGPTPTPTPNPIPNPDQEQRLQVRSQDFDAVVNASAVAAAILGELRWREAALDVEY